MVVARTFSKAYGLAGLRIGALLGAPEVLEPLRRVVPPYTINVCALAALGPALDDVEHLSWYRDQVERSRRRIYAACARWQLDCWPSLANFVLVRVGARAAWLARALAARGILVRDRTAQPGCAGCLRITAGVEAETDRCLAAMEELLCAGP